MSLIRPDGSKMSTRKSSQRNRSDIPIGDVISAVMVGIGKAKKRKRITTTNKTKPRTKKIRKFGWFPSSDDSDDSDYEPDDEEKTEKQLEKNKSTKLKRPIKNKTITRRRSSQKQKISTDNKKNVEKRQKRFVISSSNEENESYDDDEKPSTSKKCRLYERKSAMSCNVSNIIARKNVYFENSSSDDDDNDRKKLSTTKNLSYKTLKRPSLKRFRSSSSSEDLEKLTGVVETKFVISSSTKKFDVESTKKRTTNNYVGKNLFGDEIPAEILAKIFQFAIIAEGGGAVPFLIRMQRVCRHWRMVAKTPMLWTVLDLDFQKKIKDQKLALQFLPNFIAYAKSLSLSRWEKLRIVEFDNLLQKNTKTIVDLDLSFCSALTPKRLFENSLPIFCPDLRSLNISYFCTINDSLATVLRNYLTRYGKSLRCLYLNGNTLSRFHVFCDSFKATNCMENLRVLDISRVVCQTVQSARTNVVDFVKAFPNLTNLYVSDAVVNFHLPPQTDLVCLRVKENVDIWPNLVEVEFAVTEKWWGFVDVLESFMKCLSKCANLRRLSVSGHKLGDTLDLLRETPLTHLNISRTSNITGAIVQTMEKWSSTLKVLDVSWMKCYDVLPEICQLLIAPPSDRPLPPLQSLNVAGTPITAERLKSIMSACPFLEHLDCNSCRSLPLGMKRAYNSDEIPSLRRKLR